MRFGFRSAMIWSRAGDGIKEVPVWNLAPLTALLLIPLHYLIFPYVFLPCSMIPSPKSSSSQRFRVHYGLKITLSRQRYCRRIHIIRFVLWLVLACDILAYGSYAWEKWRMVSSRPRKWWHTAISYPLYTYYFLAFSLVFFFLFYIDRVCWLFCCSVVVSPLDGTY